MNVEKITFRLAAWLLEKGGHCPPGEGYKRVSKALKGDLRLVIERGTRVEVRCPICHKNFQYDVPTDNAPVRLYCGEGCKNRAIQWRKNPRGVAYCKSPSKNQYPSLEVARNVQHLMDDDEAWKLNAYPCPVGHWHIGRVQGRIISTPNEKEKTNAE